MAPFVRFGKGEFIGRDALLAEREGMNQAPVRRLRTVVIGGRDWLPIYGGEAVRIDGVVAGRLRSAAYGYTVERTVATVYLPGEIEEGSAIEIDVFAGREPGVVAADVLHDPTGARMRG